jgi:hypothetical protein
MAERGRVAPRLRLCRGCRQFVNHDHDLCPFCNGDLDALEADHDARQAEFHRAFAALRRAVEAREKSSARRRGDR